MSNSRILFLIVLGIPLLSTGCNCSKSETQSNSQIVEYSDTVQVIEDSLNCFLFANAWHDTLTSNGESSKVIFLRRIAHISYQSNFSFEFLECSFKAIFFDYLNDNGANEIEEFFLKFAFSGEIKFKLRGYLGEVTNGFDLKELNSNPRYQKLRYFLERPGQLIWDGKAP